MYRRSFFRLLATLAALAAFGLPPAAIRADELFAMLAQPSIVYKVRSTTERLEMTVQSSRILTLDQKIPQAQVSNPDILELTPLSPNQVQISAKATGVTQVNLWSEDKKLFTIDVIVYGDARELTMILQSTFPNAALKVVPLASSVLISGFVDRPEHIDRIVRIAEEYYPKVINNMTVGGCQQVLLHVKVMEVSRTKLRQLGFDWAQISGSNVFSSGPSGLLSDYNPTELTSPGNLFRMATASTFAFNVIDGSNAFFGVLDALRQDNLMKIMAEPTLVTINGEIAMFDSGGEIPVPVPQSLGTISISWKKYGTSVEFVPIVLGNGKIRLDVHPRVSELDATRSFTIGTTQVPAIKLREVQTVVEMTAGQTLAIAGLVQTRVEAQNAGLPWISEVPYLGAAFRSVKEERNEVELLIMVTPELVEAMDADEVPQYGPGMRTTSPNDWQLFMRGHLEMPNCPADGPDGVCPSGEESPPEGMILGPDETIPTPRPTDAAGRPMRMARRQSASTSQSRYSPSQPNSSTATYSPSPRNGPPGFLGPVGYDVVK